MKREYMKPAMKVVQLRQHQYIICASGDRYVKGVSTNAEGIKWADDGIVEGDDY